MGSKVQEQRDKMLADHYYKKFKQTGRLSYALLRQAITGDGDLSAGKHHS